jgi:hypothetical protein
MGTIAYEGYLKNANMAPKGMEQEHVVTVLEKPFYDSYRDGYLVKVRTETNDTETFQISNSYLKDKWKPEDRTNSLEANHTYFATTWGTRNSVIHTYKNIIEVRELTNQEEITTLSEKIRIAEESERVRQEAQIAKAKNNTNSNKGGLY